MKKLILATIILGSFFTQTVNAGLGHVSLGFEPKSVMKLKPGEVLVKLPNGKKLVGTPLKNGGVSIKRLTHDGVLDTTFGLNDTGFYTTKSIYSDLAIKVKPNGKILLTGKSQHGKPMSVKLLIDGILDSD